MARFFLQGYQKCLFYLQKNVFWKRVSSAMFVFVNTIGIWWKLFGRLVRFFLQVCQTSFLHIEDINPVKTVFYCKLGSAILFDFVVISFWQAQEHFNFWCPMEDSGENIFLEKLVFVSFLSDWSWAKLGVWPENLMQVFEATFYWASEIFLGKCFYWKTFNFANFCGGRDKYLRSIGWNILTVFSKLFSSFRKELFEEKHTLWKKNVLNESFGTLMD